MALFFLSLWSRTAYIDISGYLDQPHALIRWFVHRLHNHQPLRTKPLDTNEKDWGLPESHPAFLIADGLGREQQWTCAR